MSHPLQATIEELWERRTELSPDSPPTTIAAINSVIGELDTGKLRVAEKIAGEWITHQWIKKAVLLSFRVRDNRLQIAGDLRFFDKVDSKFENWTREQFRQGGFRAIPGFIGTDALFGTSGELDHDVFEAKGAVDVIDHANAGRAGTLTLPLAGEIANG